MMLTFKAERLYDVLCKRGNGLHAEVILRDQARMSHGTFLAARKELIDEGLLTITYQGRKPYYEVHGNDEARIDIEVETIEQKQDKAPICGIHVNRSIPRLTGTFETLFHWSESISTAIGGDIDLTPMTGDPGLVRLYSYKHRMSDLYHIDEEDEFVTVRAEEA